MGEFTLKDLEQIVLINAIDGDPNTRKNKIKIFFLRLKYKISFSAPSIFICRIKSKIRDRKDKIKWFIQRGKYGYSDYDRWDIDEWFLDVMPRMLIEFKEKTNSYPGNEEFDTPEKWSDYLNDMICILNKIRNYRDENILFKDEDLASEITEASYEELKQKFFSMFSHVFENLWD